MRAIELAHEDGFSGVELNEDHLHRLVDIKPGCLNLIREYSSDKRMVNSIHKTLHRPSIDSLDRAERNRAVEYTLRTLDYMESAGISRMVLHSFSDLPGFLSLKGERINKITYVAGCNVVKVYGILAPVLKAYRKTRGAQLQRSFMSSLSEIAKYAYDKNVNDRPIEIVFEEHYSDTINYDEVSYGRGSMINVIRGIDTAHQLIRTGKDTDLSGISSPIHFHAVDTNGVIDDHRTVGSGKVNFEKSLTSVVERKLTNVIVVEDSTRKSSLQSKNALMLMINRIGI